MFWLGDILDRFLSRVTSYRLVLYILALYVLAATIFSAFGLLPFAWHTILFSAASFLIICRSVNFGLAKLFNIPRNKDSDLISALILTLIITPAVSAQSLPVFALAGTLAMASKYLLVVGRRHIFNPAALGALGAGLLLGQSASWWVGAPIMLPLLILGGILILRKMKRFLLAISFLSIFSPVLLGPAAAPIIFFATIMLIEPSTSPLSLGKEISYGALTGILYISPQFGLPISLLPEVALLLGNIFNFIISNNRRVALKFVEKKQEAAGIQSFAFEPDRKIKFKAGQFMEWTLPQNKSDSRGNRRYLTIASSPTEPNMMVALRIPDRPSQFKQKLTTLKPNEAILASELAGTFVLPEDRSAKTAFLAGGIGITPFRSMVKYCLDTNESRPMTLLYFAQKKEEFCFADLFDSAGSRGLETLYITDKISAELLKEKVLDYPERIFYLSGPLGFVQAAKKALLDLKVPRTKIKTDFFPGYD